MKFFSKLSKAKEKIGTLSLATVTMSVMGSSNAWASQSGSASIDDMLGIFSKLFAWILKEGAILLNWMLDKPILMIAMGLFFCGAIIAFLMRIYHSV